MKSRALSWLTLLTLALSFALAAPLQALADDDDPPSRVARLSSTRGEVSFSPAGTEDWVSAVLNRPLTTGDKLWTDRDARAELHVGSAAIRLTGETGFSFLNLDDNMMQIRLTEGSASLRVRRLDQDESIEVDTPNLAFSILRPGFYRVTVNEAGDATIINVREGQGEVTGGGSAYTVNPGQQGYFSGLDSLDADFQPLPGDDDFDRWCKERDLREEHTVARRYVSDDVIGYEDLDDYGGWRPVPEYGTIWFPHVTVVGWAPYRYGHWAWVSPWGWTWVDDAPWGFAPFHYGRWVVVGGAWGWVPCPPRAVAVAYVRPVYAPALVAWVGGPHFAVGVAVGGGVGANVGWFPLGPREVYAPSYHVSRNYINNVNISNTTVNQTVINNYYNTTVVNKNVTNIKYVNQNVTGAVTATSSQTFTSAQPVSRHLVAVNQREIASAQVVAAAPAVVPPKQAVLGSGVATRVQPPAALQTRAVIAKTAPPPPPPSYQQRAAAIEANQGRPISIAQSRQIATEHARNAVVPVKIAPPATPAAPRVNNVRPTPTRGGQPVQTQTVQPVQPNANRPPNTNVNANPNVNPNSNINPNTNANQANKPADPRVNQDRPPSTRPTTAVNPQLEQKHQEQVQQLQQKQDQQYQKLQQKQYQEQQKLQQQAEQQKINQQKQEQVQQKQQQQLERMEQKHDQQQKVLKDKQQTEHSHSSEKPAKPPKDDKDKPPHH
jgi:hypothetical protein